MNFENLRKPLLVDFYLEFHDSGDAKLFLESVSARYTLGSLERLARSDFRLGRRAAVFALGLLGSYESNNVLGTALCDADRGVRSLAEDGIRTLWRRTGSHQHRRQLDRIVTLNDARHFLETIRHATELIDRAPWFAEAWNQRAIAYFGLTCYSEAIRDCRQALEINPYHFAAAARMGECHLKLSERADALACFRRALRLNPNLEQVRVQVVRLQKSLADE